MDLSKLKPSVIKILSQSGWCKERDMTLYLKLTGEKNMSSEFSCIARSFVGLEVFYVDKKKRECSIYFDLDESKVSKDMRARYYNYESHLDPKWLIDPDYRESEDFEVTATIIEKIGKPCSRVGFWDECEIGFDLYVSEDGEIYAGNYDDPVLIGSSFVDFLNKQVGS